MDAIEKIRELVTLMDEKGLAELEVEEPELRIKIKTNLAVSAKQIADSQAVPPAATLAQADGLASQAVAEEAPVEGKAEEGYLKIISPMVGTFYRAPSDGSEPYVTVGTIVEPDTVACIIEAMKVMNEIKAEVSGEIVEILVQNAEPVEYGQVLFLLRPEE